MAGQEVQGMLIRLEATTAQLRQEMDKADASVTKATGRIDSQLSRVDSAFDRVGKSAQTASNVLKGAFALAVGGAGAGALLAQAEAYTTVANRLKLVTSNSAEFTAAQNAVFAIAQKSGQPLGATAELYQRIAQNQDALKLSGKGVAGIVETISKTMVISGTSAESANAALIQLGQAFASGTLRGEELNSVMEQAPALSQAIAKGMGVSVGALRALGAAGKLTADSVIKALQAQAEAVNALFAKMQGTVGIALTRTQTAFTKIIGEADAFSGTSASLAASIDAVAKALSSINVPAAMAVIEAHGKALAEILGVVLIAALGRVAAGLAEAGVKAAGNIVTWVQLTTVTRAAAAAKIEETAASALLTAAHVAEAASNVQVAQATEAGAIAKLALLQGQRDQLAYTTALSVGTVEQARYTKALAATDLELAAAKRAVQISSAQLDAALKIESATLAKDAAATQAASAAKAEYAAISSTAGRAGSALLGVLGGPVGLAFTVVALAASYLTLGSSTDAATKALIDQNATVGEAIKKFDELDASQQRLQTSKWVGEQRDALKSAAADLESYAAKSYQSLNLANRGNTEYQEQFARMLAEVRDGKRTLDSVTAWAQDTAKLTPMQVQRLTELSAAYGASTKRASELGDVLGKTSKATTGLTASTQELNAAQKTGGQSGASDAAWDTYIEKLTKTRDLLGANAAAEAAYTAAKMGATPAQMAQAKLIADETDTLKKYQEAIKEGNKVEQAALKLKLVALYAAEDATAQTAAAQKTSLDEAAKATENSATRQVAALQRIIDQTVRVATGTDMPRQNLSGYGLLTNGGTPPAAPVVTKATPDQRATADIARLNETTDANKRVDKAANAAATALKNQAKALDDLLAKSGISTKSANEMADAYLAGADNVRAITIQQKIEEELLKTGAGARDKVTKAINDLQDAEDRRDVNKNITEMKVEVDQILKQATATLQGKDALEAYNVEKSVTVALAGRNISVGSEEYKQLVATTKAQLDANKALEQAGQVEGIVDRLTPKTKLLRDFTNEQDALNAAIARYPENAALYQDALVKLGKEYEVNQSKATIWGQLTEGAVDRIDGVFADAWANIGSGAGNLWDNLVKGAKQAFGEIAHMLTTKPLLASLSNWLTGTDNGQGIGSVWSKLLGTVGGSSGSSSAGDSGGWGSMASLGKNIYSAWSAVTGVGADIAAGYASGGISGAVSGGIGYYSSMLSSLGGTLSSGFTSLTTALGLQTAATTAGTAAVGTGYGLGGALVSGTAGSATYAAGQAGLSAALSSAAAMWPLAVIMGMYQSGKLYSAGVRPDAGEMADSAGGTVLGKTTMLPAIAAAKYFEVTDKLLGKVVGGKMAAILSGSTLFQAVWSKVGSKLFGSGYQTKDTGIQLSVDDGMFDASQYIKQKKKKGLISGSSKTRYLTADLDPTIKDPLGQRYNSTVMTVLDQFTLLNVALNDTVLDGLNMAKRYISTKDRSEDDINTAIDLWFTDLGQAAVTAVSDATNSGIGNYNFVQLQEFVGNLYSINDTFKLLNINALPLSVWGGKLTEQYVAMAGGMEALNTSASKYYDNFFSDSEKASDTLAAVNQQFQALGLTLPANEAGFRAMVEGIDSTTDAGRSMYFTLMGLSDSAKAAYTIMKQQAADAEAASEAASQAASAAAQAALDAATAIRDALLATVSTRFSAVQRAIAAQEKATTDAYNARVNSLNDMLATANTSVSDLTGVSGNLSSALKALRGDSDDVVKMLRRQAQVTLQSALATAKAGGSLAGFAGLDDALETVSSNTTDLYSSLEDFNRDQGRTANVVAELNALNGKQLTNAQKTVKTLEDQLDVAKTAYDAQIAAFDQQLEFAQAQLDALNGVDNSILSVTDAVNAMNTAVVAALGTVKSATPANTGTLIDTVYKDLLGKNADAAGKNYWQGQVSSGAVGVDQLAGAIKNAATENAIKDAYKNILDRVADAAGAKYWSDQVASGALTVAQLGQAIANAAKANGSVPAFATGGLISGPGTGTSDSILARLSAGEYVMKASAVSAYGTSLLDQMNAGQLPSFATGGAPELRFDGAASYRATRSETADSQGDEQDVDVTALARKVDTLIDVVKQVVGPMKIDSDKNRKLFTKWDNEGLPATKKASVPA